MEDKKYAVLIDSDNISSKYITCILSEMTKYGVVTYKRIYGDWTSTQTTKWKKELLENSIMPIQQFSNTVGKNATDSALIIDAMDILYTGNVNGFCIVSSDGDFTRLAARLRESGMEVIGMGEEKTPRSFRAACTVFTSLEVLLAQEEEDDVTLACELPSDKGGNSASQASLDVETVSSGVISQRVIENDIAAIISENDDKDRDTGLGEIGSRLVKKYSDFDVRNYGYSSLSRFLEDIDSFELVRRNNALTIRIKDNKDQKRMIENYAMELLRANGKNGVKMETLGRKLHDKFDNFKVKDYGYSSFAKFVQSFQQVEIRENQNKNKIVYIKEH